MSPSATLAAAVLCVAAASCARYEALKPAAPPALAAGVQGLAHDGVDVAAPLSVAGIASLALQNNPDLVAARAQSEVARAQRLQAGLPPNPQVSGALLPLVAGFGSTLGWNAGITEDIKSLITLRARRRAADRAVLQVDADIVWQEWQTAGQARLLATDLMLDARAIALLRDAAALFRTRADRTARAMAAGDATLVTAAPDATVLQTAEAQLADAERQSLARRHQLAALLGLAPDAPFRLAATPDLPAYDPLAVAALLPGLAQRRPDLVALRFGIEAQDARYRAAILGQFPNLSFGASGGSDNSNVRQAGPQISLELPLFDRNQGNIAIEKTTRAQLQEAYAARIAQTDGQVRAMLGEIAALERALGVLRQDLAGSARVAADVRAAYGSRDLDERTAVDLIAVETAKRVEVLAMERSVLEQRVAIATLVGDGLPMLGRETGA